MSDLNKELQEQKEQNINFQAEIRELHTQVRKWSTYCAYVAGSSIGIILFLQILSSEEPSCPECDICETCPEPILCKEATQVIEASKTTIKEVPSVQKQPIVKETSKPEVIKEVPIKAEYEFPMKYTIKSGENFSILSSRFYKRASLADWLAKQNNIDPSKLQIGQEVTIPAPPQ
jgi:hypothetical protein